MLLPYLVLFLLHIRFGFASCAHGTVLHPRKAAAPDNSTVELPDFDYGPDRGPTNWHALSPKNILCGTGRSQSPINLDKSKSSSVLPLRPRHIKMDIPNQDVLFENLGVNVEVVLKGHSLVGKRKFNIKQFHFHTPSEHLIQGKYYPAEVHLVHVAEDNPTELLVIAIMLEMDKRELNAPFDKLMSHIEHISRPGQTTTIRDFDMSYVVRTINKTSTLSYKGSLTTPPCTEGVTFLTLTKPIPIGFDGFHKLKDVVGFNARFLQSHIPAKHNVLVSGVEHLGMGVVICPAKNTTTQHSALSRPKALLLPH
ncbi:hypothetical protein FQN57_001504 [Myotisia sp. PD_48]|nr:hypothetical protein FQN57_001504 [Myotisia sp. PD_48]